MTSILILKTYIVTELSQLYTVQHGQKKGKSSQLSCGELTSNSLLNYKNCFLTTDKWDNTLIDEETIRYDINIF